MGLQRSWDVTWKMCERMLALGAKSVQHFDSKVASVIIRSGEDQCLQTTGIQVSLCDYLSSLTGNYFLCVSTSLTQIKGWVRAFYPAEFDVLAASRLVRFFGLFFKVCKSFGMMFEACM